MFQTVLRHGSDSESGGERVSSSVHHKKHTKLTWGVRLPVPDGVRDEASGIAICHATHVDGLP